MSKKIRHPDGDFFNLCLAYAYMVYVILPK